MTAHAELLRLLENLVVHTDVAVKPLLVETARRAQQDYDEALADAERWQRKAEEAEYKQRVAEFRGPEL